MNDFQRRALGEELDNISVYLRKLEKTELVKRLVQIRETLGKLYETGDSVTIYSTEQTAVSLLTLLEFGKATPEKVEVLEAQIQEIQSPSLVLEELEREESFQRNILIYAKMMDGFTKALENMDVSNLENAKQRIFDIRNTYFAMDTRSEIFESALACASYEIIAEMLRIGQSEEIEPFIQELKMDSDLENFVHEKIGEIILSKAERISYQDLAILSSFFTGAKKIDVHDIALWSALTRADKEIEISQVREEKNTTSMSTEKKEETEETVEPKKGTWQKMKERQEKRRAQREQKEAVKNDAKQNRNKMKSSVGTSKASLLTSGQCFGADSLEVLYKRGVGAPITDFAIALGGYVENYFFSNPSRKGSYWTKSNSAKGENIRVSTESERITSRRANNRAIGARIVMPFSSIESIPQNEGSKPHRANDWVLEVEYGHYPQQAAPKEINIVLEEEFQTLKKTGQEGALKKTGNVYTTDSRRDTKTYLSFSPIQHEEYEYKGKRYVRVKFNYGSDRSVNLSNREEYDDGDYVWMEVTPVKWLVDEKAGVMVTNKIMFAGVRLAARSTFPEEKYEESEMQSLLFFLLLLFPFFCAHFLESVLDRKRYQ